MKPRVLLDCDGILADFVGGALPLLEFAIGRSVSRDEITEFDFAKSLGLGLIEASRFKRAVGSARRLANRLEVYPGAKDGVRRLRDCADVFIVTSSWDSNETWEFDRKAWLKRHFDIGRHDIVFTAAKHLCVGDYFVDDKTSTLETWRAAHPCGVAIQWITPHNRRDAWTGPSTANWDTLIDWVQNGVATRGGAP